MEGDRLYPISLTALHSLAANSKQKKKLSIFFRVSKIDQKLKDFKCNPDKQLYKSQPHIHPEVKLFFGALGSWYTL